MNLSPLGYKLPKELIAQEPAKPRDFCRLMVLRGNRIYHKRFYEIADFLEAGDVLVLNKSKVIPARLKGNKITGGKAEFIVISKKGNLYKCKIKASKVRIGAEFIFRNKLRAKVIGKEEGIFLVRFNKQHIGLDKIGELPTPPYIKRKVRERDYQTVYAKTPGSFAAPTAGLHFTKRLLNRLKKKGINIAFITLHINLLTFLPIREEDFTKHNAGKEYFHVDRKNAGIINSCKKNIIAVGTTTLKALESSCRNGKIIPGKGYSDLFIYPSYKFKTNVKALITNFHLPKSSLLLLTCAFAGTRRLLDAYKEAIKKRYRFYSLGDGMIIFK